MKTAAASIAGASRPTRVAIVGSGPAGSTLAALLAEKGVDVCVFSGGKRPELLVGESVIPAVIPILRRLGIEEEVAAISRHKPGATFVWKRENPIELSFSAVEGVLPAYAYNVPRPAFDRLVEERAKRSGAEWRDTEAGMRKAPAGSGRELELTEEALALAPASWNEEQPDLIVDASGRRRTAARLLEVPSRTGPRRDTAYFAHYEGWKQSGPDGQIIIIRLEGGGWSWQIPLRACVSVGVVIPPSHPAMSQAGPVERLEAVIEADPLLAAAGAERRRVTGVPVYTNYQLISERGAGPGWVMAGDAFGFVDPMLSPGLWIAMRGGELLADAIPARSRPGPLSPALLEGYTRETEDMLVSWQFLVEKFYNGAMAASHAAGMAIMEKHPGAFSRMFQNHVQRNFAGMACGAYTQRAYSKGLLGLLCRHTYGYSPADYAIS